jgi:hypothetical protein
MLATNRRKSRKPVRHLRPVATHPAGPSPGQPLAKIHPCTCSSRICPQHHEPQVRQQPRGGSSLTHWQGGPGAMVSGHLSVSWQMSEPFTLCTIKHSACCHGTPLQLSVVATPLNPSHPALLLQPYLPGRRAGTSEAHPGSPTSAQSSRGGDMSERSHGTHSQQYAVLAEVVPARDASTLAAHPGLTPHMLMMMANENGHSPPPTAHRRHAYHASDTPVQYAPARGERVRTMMGIFQPRSSYF